MPVDRRPAWTWLPALCGAVMLAGGSAAAMPMSVVLCSGSNADFPAKTPGKDCDQACHAGCQRRKGRG